MMTRTREATENLLEQVRGDDGIWTADTSFTRFFKAPDGRETAHTVGCSAFQLPAASVSPTFWTDIAGDGHGPIGRSSQLSTLLANEFGVAVVEGDENTAIGTGGRSDRLRFDDSLPPLVSNFVRRTALPQEGDFFGDWAVTVLRYPVPLFGSPPSEITPLREAAQLYRGELLNDTSIRDAAFEDWLSAERSRLRTAAMKILDRLILLEEGHSRIAAATS